MVGGCPRSLLAHAHARTGKQIDPPDLELSSPREHWTRTHAPTLPSSRMRPGPATLFPAPALALSSIPLFDSDSAPRFGSRLIPSCSVTQKDKAMLREARPGGVCSASEWRLRRARHFTFRLHFRDGLQRGTRSFAPGSVDAMLVDTQGLFVHLRGEGQTAAAQSMAHDEY